MPGFYCLTCRNANKFGRNQPLLQLMVNWIKDHRSNLSIQMVLCTEDGGHWCNGRDGWLRILEFLSDSKTMKVYTNSRLFFISPSTRHLSWRKEAYDEFTFVY